MKRSTTLWITCILGLGASCGESSNSHASSNSSHFITINSPNRGWAESIEYRSDGEYPTVTMDGVGFELRDPAAYLLDWKAIGMEGISHTSNVSYESTEPVEGAFLAVSGKAVEVREGVLFWGDTALGPVAEGDQVVVDAEGLRLPE